MSPYKPLDIAALHHKSRHQGLLQPDECAQASANIAAGWRVYVEGLRLVERLKAQGADEESLLPIKEAIAQYGKTVKVREDLLGEPDGGQFPCPEWWDLSGTQDS